MKKRGFTLIELLAVIVILAIIALIATPAVLNIIEDSRKGAAEASARNIINSAKTYYMQSTMNNNTVESIDLSTDTLKYDGDQATKGTITFDNGKASGKMYVGGYCVEVAVDGKVSSEKAEEDECEITETPSEPTTYTKYNDGTPLLYDPVNNVKCIESEVETNVNAYKSTHNYTTKVWQDGGYVNISGPTISGLKDGCMKWYAFLDSEDSSTVNLILDHNTTDYVAWNSNSSGTTPDTVNAELQADITNWNASVKSTARLISASEVNQIAPTAEGFTWIETDYSTYYYLHTGLHGKGNEYEGAAGSNTYAWLFDNTYDCTQYGCNAGDRGTNGYWTSSFASSGHAWLVGYYGGLSRDAVDFGNGVAVRPVITISKSIFN